MSTTDADYVNEACKQTLQLLSSFEDIRLVDLNGGHPGRITHAHNGIDHVRARLVPDMHPRRPRKFWDSNWCFYEIGVGQYPIPERSMVRFFMAGNSASCGSGAHNAAVDAILSRAKTKRPELEYHRIGPRGYAWLAMRYPMPVPDPVKMASDLAWIITETYHQFIALPCPAQ